MTNATDMERVVMHAVREIRLQTSVVRTLLDEVETVEPALHEGTHEHFVEELARLGCRLLETASALSTKK